MVDNDIINLADPTDDEDAENKQFLQQEVHKSLIKPSHKTNQFVFLMQNTLEWSDVTPVGNSFNMTNIADLSPEQGNVHSHKYKVIETRMITNSQGGYSYKMGSQRFSLIKYVNYTLCIEILITDHQLSHKSGISIDKATSKGLTIGNLVVKKFSHRYIDSSKSTEFMYCQKVIVNFRKTVPDPPY